MHGAIEMENLCFKEGGQQGPQMLWVFWTLKSEDFLPLYAHTPRRFAIWGRNQRLYDTAYYHSKCCMEARFLEITSSGSALPPTPEAEHVKKHQEVILDLT
jgi:hypothetical protein